MASMQQEDNMARWIETALAAATTTGLVTGLVAWMVVFSG